MTSQKVLPLVNAVLCIVILLLLLSLFDIQVPSIGKAISYFDKKEPLLLVQYEDNIAQVPDLSRGCLEARAQLRCNSISKQTSFGEVSYECSTGINQPLRYLLNNKAYLYCKEEGIWGVR